VHRFSNINWAAFLLGTPWGGFNRFFGWLVLALATVAVIMFGFFYGGFLGDRSADATSAAIAIAIVLTGYISMGVAAVYLALRGNHMLSEEIKQKRWSLEKETTIRVRASARQYKQLMWGIVLKLWFYFSLVRGLSTSELPDYVIFAPFIIDTLSFAAVLALAAVLHEGKNELYSGNEIDFKLIMATPVVREVVRKGAETESDNWDECEKTSKDGD